MTWPPPGRYILAVSGGADSMVLLDVLAGAAAARGYDLIVAHFDHGLRVDSGADAQFVAASATRHGLPYEHRAAALGAASEAAARAARHHWLEGVRVRCGSEAILTAHHQDDQLETSLLNLARGSGRLGLAPMQPRATILRPLIAISRADLRAYAASAHVGWREDPTNADISNPRNLLRHNILAGATPIWRAAYLELIAELALLNTKIDRSIINTLVSWRSDLETYSLPAGTIATLSPPELEEYILAAARVLRPGIQLDRRLVAEAAAFARTGRSRKYRPLRQGIVVHILPDRVNVTTKTPV